MCTIITVSQFTVTHSWWRHNCHGPCRVHEGHGLQLRTSGEQNSETQAFPLGSPGLCGCDTGKTVVTCDHVMNGLRGLNHTQEVSGAAATLTGSRSLLRKHEGRIGGGQARASATTHGEPGETVGPADADDDTNVSGGGSLRPSCRREGAGRTPTSSSLNLLLRKPRRVHIAAWAKRFFHLLLRLSVLATAPRILSLCIVSTRAVGRAHVPSHFPSC